MCNTNMDSQLRHEQRQRKQFGGVGSSGRAADPHGSRRAAVGVLVVELPLPSPEGWLFQGEVL